MPLKEVSFRLFVFLTLPAFTIYELDAHKQIENSKNAVSQQKHEFRGRWGGFG